MPTDDEEPKENGTQFVNGKKSQESNVEQPNFNDGSEKDSVEQKNFNLLEVTKLLIDTTASTQLTLDVDEDLFSDFQSITSATPNEVRPEVIISMDIFEDFAKSQSKATAVNEESTSENKGTDFEESNMVEATVEEHNHDNKNVYVSVPWIKYAL